MSILTLLRPLVASDPLIQEIDFAERGIELIDVSAIQVLSRFSELRAINLEGNKIKSVP